MYVGFDYVSVIELLKLHLHLLFWARIMLLSSSFFSNVSLTIPLSLLSFGITKLRVKR